MQEEAIIPLRLTTHLGRHYIVRTVQTGPKDYLTTAAWRHDWGRVKIIFQYPTHSEEKARRKHQETCTYCATYGVKDNEA